MKFWTLWAIDAVIAMIGVYYFVVGLADGSVSSFNIGLWLQLLLVLVVVLGGGLWLKSAGRPGLATILVLLLALPGILYALFVVVLLITVPRWN
jgi:hypothetical protein